MKRDRISEIEEIVDRETRAWDAKNVELLLTVFHPDMVWPWPPDPGAHDPAGWVMPFGRYDAARWRANWEELFRTHELVHNRRAIVRIEVSRKATERLRSSTSTRCGARRKGASPTGSAARARSTHASGPNGR